MTRNRMIAGGLAAAAVVALVIWLWRRSRAAPVVVEGSMAAGTSTVVRPRLPPADMTFTLAEIDAYNRAGASLGGS